MVSMDELNAETERRREARRSGILRENAINDAVFYDVCPSCKGNLVQVRTGLFACLLDAVTSREAKRCTSCGGRFDLVHNDGA